MKIYLIWWPPKCGKTTLSKRLSKVTGIPYISTDTIENVLMYYLNPENFAKNILKKNTLKSNDDFYSKYSSEEIRDSYIEQSKTSYKAIRSIVETSIIEEDNIIIEWFHITPELVSELQQEFTAERLEIVFLVKTNREKFLEDIHKSSTPNDWIIQKTKLESTFVKIATMIISYGGYFKQEANKYNLNCLDLSENFTEQIDVYIKNNTHV